MADFDRNGLPGPKLYVYGAARRSVLARQARQAAERQAVALAERGRADEAADIYDEDAPGPDWRAEYAQTQAETAPPPAWCEECGYRADSVGHAIQCGGGL